MHTIGTAGHVDHGKSTLVQALTGINPDRWPEERARAMTIDLGFAWMTTPAGRRLSLIDVPGHERFIKNMLAGVGGLDAVLLVIAADEGIRQQTVEHRAIIDLLGVDRGLVVLTKRDLVDDEWLALMAEEVGDGLRGTSLAGAPIVAVSAKTGAGLLGLLAALDGLLSDLPSRAANRGSPRLPIDRAFSVSGFGTVVTGTLLDGPLALGAEVEIQPAGLRGRVRGLQSHQTRLEVALPGTRVAVNLGGVDRQALARGDVLALPGQIAPTVLVDVRLRLLPDAPPLKHNDPLDVFVGAAEVAAHAALLDRETLEPGADGWVQLRLARPIAAVRGERCIVRRASPSRTVGGGPIIDAHPARHRRFRPAVVAALETLARGAPEELLAQALGDGPPLEWRAVLDRCGLDEPAGLAALAAARNNGSLLVVPPDATPQPGAIVVSRGGWSALGEQIKRALGDDHARWRLRRGMSREALRSRLKLAPRPFNAVIAQAVAEGWLADDGATLRLPGHAPAPTAAEERTIAAALSQWRAAPTTPPGRETLDALDPEVLGWLLDSGKLVRVSSEVCFLPETYAAMRGWVDERLDSGAPLTLAAFRDAWSTTRKYAQAFLEHLDDLKVTRRVGEARVRT